MTVKGHLLKSASVIALVTVISRICGYLRDQRVALLLGTSPAADSLVLVFRDSQSDTAVVGGGGAGCGVYPGVHRLPERQAAGHSMVVRAKGILGHGGDSGSARCVGSGVRAADYSLLYDFLAQLGAVGSGGFSGADHYSGDILCGAGRDRGGYAQQLSGVRIARGDADIFQSGADSVFAGSCVPAGDANGAGSVSNARGGDRVRDSAGRNYPVCGSDSGARAAGHAFPARSIFQRSGSAESSALDGAGGFRSGRLPDEFLRGQDFLDVVADADREA